MKVLDSDEANKKLEKLPANWFIGSSGELSSEFSFDSVAKAKKFINLVIDASEEANHHPNLNWSYQKVELSVSTHEAGGLTEKDFKLAGAVEACLRKL